MQLCIQTSQKITEASSFLVHTMNSIDICSITSLSKPTLHRREDSDILGSSLLSKILEMIKVLIPTLYAHS